MFARLGRLVFVALIVGAGLVGVGRPRVTHADSCLGGCPAPQLVGHGGVSPHPRPR